MMMCGRLSVATAIVFVLFSCCVQANLSIVGEAQTIATTTDGVTMESLSITAASTLTFNGVDSKVEEAAWIRVNGTERAVVTAQLAPTPNGDMKWSTGNSSQEELTKHGITSTSSVVLYHHENSTVTYLYATQRNKMVATPIGNGPLNIKTIENSPDMDVVFAGPGAALSAGRWLMPLLAADGSTAMTMVVTVHAKQGPQYAFSTRYSSVGKNQWTAASVVALVDDEDFIAAMYLVSSNKVVYRTRLSKETNEWTNVHVIDVLTGGRAIAAVGAFPSSSALLFVASSNTTDDLQATLVDAAMATNVSGMALIGTQSASSLGITPAMDGEDLAVSYIMCTMSEEEKKEVLVGCALKYTVVSPVAEQHGEKKKAPSTAVAITITFVIIGSVVFVLSVIFLRGFLRQRSLATPDGEDKHLL